MKLDVRWKNHDNAFLWTIYANTPLIRICDDAPWWQGDIRDRRDILESVKRGDNRRYDTDCLGICWYHRNTIEAYWWCPTCEPILYRTSDQRRRWIWRSSDIVPSRSLYHYQRFPWYFYRRTTPSHLCRGSALWTNRSCIVSSSQEFPECVPFFYCSRESQSARTIPVWEWSVIWYTIWWAPRIERCHLYDSGSEREISWYRVLWCGEGYVHLRYSYRRKDEI